MLEVAVSHRQGAFTLDVAFTSGPGITALFGRSGAGKTSLVNIIAGLVRPERGRVTVDGAALVDTARGVMVPAHRRRIGYVFQEARLFPHLSVRRNLLFGRWFSPRSERHASLDDVVALLGIGHLLERRPAALSGGETQRVAIGRALLASPRLLLMDEPLAALDAERKAEILPYIERLRDETRIPIVYVSHGIGEVTRLATTMVVLAEGRVEAAGPLAEVMDRLDLYPQIGHAEAGSILQARVTGHDARFGLTELITAAGALTVAYNDLPVGTPVRVRTRARDIIVAIAPPHGLSALNVLAGHIAEIGPASDAACDIRIALAQGSLLARVTERSISELGLVPGRPVYAVMKSVAIDRQALGSAPAGAAKPE